MAGVKLTQALRLEYETLFNECKIRTEYQSLVAGLVAQIQKNKARYEVVGNGLGIPWSFIAVIHNMESSFNFTRHLHNGDPLSKRTVQVPAGRPINGQPPFTWEQSATDALTLKGLGASTEWTLAGTLYQLERYNGWGYRQHHPQVLTPYLWSFSNHYRSGKYVADGTWSDTAVSKQCGAAVLLRRLSELGLVDFVDQPAVDVATAIPMVPDYSMKKSSDANLVRQIELLQAWLNTFPGIFVKVDGVPGRKTSDAYKKVTGNYLPGDPGV